MKSIAWMIDHKEIIIGGVATAYTFLDVLLRYGISRAKFKRWQNSRKRINRVASRVYLISEKFFTKSR